MRSAKRTRRRSTRSGASACSTSRAATTGTGSPRRFCGTVGRSRCGHAGSWAPTAPTAPCVRVGASFDEKEGQSMTMSMVDAALSGYDGDRSWVNYYVADKGFLLLTGLPGGKFRLGPGRRARSLLEGRHTAASIPAGPRLLRHWRDHRERGVVVDLADPQGGRRRLLRRADDPVRRRDPCPFAAGGQGMNACMQDAFNLG